MITLAPGETPGLSVGELAQKQLPAHGLEACVESETAPGARLGGRLQCWRRRGVQRPGGTDECRAARLTVGNVVAGLPTAM